MRGFLVLVRGRAPTSSRPTEPQSCLAKARTRAQLVVCGCRVIANSGLPASSVMEHPVLLSLQLRVGCLP